METIVVTIAEARGLLAADSNGFSDPYAVVTMCDSKGKVIPAAGEFKTPVIKKTLMPQWNFVFKIGESFDLRLATTLRIDILDQDFGGMFTKDDHLGVVEIPVNMFTGDALPKTPSDVWYKIIKHEKMKKDAKGELRVILADAKASDAPPVSAVGSPQAAAAALAKGISGFFGGPSSPPPTPVLGPDGAQAPNFLWVTIKSGKDLIAMDNDKSSDPFVKLSLAGQKHQTTVKKETLKPQWNEKFGFKLSNKNDTLKLVVDDEDVTYNDFMGRADVSLSDLSANEAKDMTLDLLDKNKKKDKKQRGTLTISLLWTFESDPDTAMKKGSKNMFDKFKSMVNISAPDQDYNSDDNDGIEFDEKEKQAKSPEELEKEKEEKEKKRQELLTELKNFEIKSGDYQVQVHVIEARDLVPKDATGTSDPVVYVDVLTEQMKTDVKKQKLNCVWDELLIFSLRDVDKADVEMGFVKLSVMDANTFQRAELIGAAQFDISYIYSMPNHQLANVWIGLVDTSKTTNQGIQGYLRASITVLGPGDKLVPPPSPFGGDSADMEGNIIMPPSVAQKVKFLCARIHLAEELVPMDMAILTKAGLDAYISASIAGGDAVRTRVRTKKGQRHELSPSFNEELMLVIREPSMADTITFAVWDWDRVTDELVAHFHHSLKMVNAMGGQVGPFWTNLYGAPLKGNKIDVGVGGDSVKKQMNKFPDMATTYRGRILMTLKVMENENDQFDETNQKRNLQKLPRDLYPRERIYKMRAHFVCGSMIPQEASAKALGQNKEMSLVLSLRLNEISSKRAKNVKGNVEWNDVEESEKMLLPEDLDQVPDIFLYLCKGSSGTRICYRRFKAKELFGFNRDLEWLLLKEDPAIDDLKDETFPGNVLVKLGFGTEEDAAAHPWDPREKDLFSQRAPYQLRVHIYQGRGLPAADSNGLLDPFLVCKVMSEKKKETTRKKMTKDPVYYETLHFDVTLPKDPRYMPQVHLRVMDHDDFDSDDYVGMVCMNMSDAHIRTSAQLANGQFSKLPDPKWYPLIFQEQGDCEGEVLASLELISKQFPDEKVPEAESIEPAKRKAFLELTILGLRSMEPYQFLPIQLPYIEFVLGGRDHAADEMTTETSKRPSARDPNFLQRIVKPVELPEDAFFAPRLNIIVKDTRLGGFQKPIVGSASLDLSTKIPWSKNYVPPQQNRFAEVDIQAADGGDENSPLLASGAGGHDPALDTDNGAGVFGALKNMGVDFDPTDPNSFNDVASQHSSQKDGDDDTKKYLRHRDLLDCELEQELQTTPFEKYALHIGQKKKKKSLMAMINPFSKKAGPASNQAGIYKIAGHFKGLIRIIEREDAKPLVDLDAVLKPQPYEIRVYVLDGVGFQPMDLGLNGRPGMSDPYLKLRLGKEKISDRKNYIEDTTDPDFYKMFRLNAMLPGASILEIDAMDHDLIGGDDLIGSTSIDLEDRLFHPKWQELGKLYQTQSRWALKPLESRTLHIPTSKAPMGAVKMWIDIMTPAEAHDYPAIDVSLPPPVEMELRVVIWKARNVPSFDEAEDMNDLFFRCWLEGSDDQETDIHWRAKKGKGSFNWRMKFPVVLGHKQPNSKYPYFHIQGWDKDIFSANDAIGECMLSLDQYFQKAYKTKTHLQFFEDDDETRNKKKKNTDDDEAVKKIKEATGLWDESNPPDSTWLKLTRKNHQTNTTENMGEVCVSMELVPKERAKQQPVGNGRSAPNHTPYLPPPAGRLSFSLNPFKVFNDLLGPSICNRIMCCLCCVAFMVIIYFLAPFINLAIVTFKK